MKLNPKEGITAMMKLFFTPLFYFLVLVSSCKSADYVKVKGTAINLHEGAIIMPKDSAFFFVNSLSKWDDVYLNRKIVVIGILDTIEPTIDSSIFWSVPTRYVIYPNRIRKDLFP